jgi:protein-tyrosine phosphatase
MQPQRHLEVQGAFNVRDLGGYETREGKRTQWRRFLRADCLEKVNAQDFAARVDGGLRTVLDLRSAREIEEKPSAFRGSESRPRYRHVDLIGDPVLIDDPAKWSQPLQPPERYLTLYSSWLDHRQEAIRESLVTLAAPDALPALFNCHAGKDRTGVIAALLLGLAGVPDDTIVADYILSGPNLWPREKATFQEDNGPDYSKQDFCAQVSSSANMALTLEFLNEKYDGIPAYLERIGLSAEEQDRLRSALLD